MITTTALPRRLFHGRAFGFPLLWHPITYTCPNTGQHFYCLLPSHDKYKVIPNTTDAKQLRLCISRAPIQRRSPTFPQWRSSYSSGYQLSHNGDHYRLHNGNNPATAITNLNSILCIQQNLVIEGIVDGHVPSATRAITGSSCVFVSSYALSHVAHTLPNATPPFFCHK